MTLHALSITGLHVEKKHVLFAEKHIGFKFLQFSTSVLWQIKCTSWNPEPTVVDGCEIMLQLVHGYPIIISLNYAVFHGNPNSYPAWCRIFQPSTVSFPIVFGYHSPIHQPKKYQPWVPFVFPLVIYHVPWFSSMLFFIEGSARTYPEVRKSQDAAWPWSSRYFSLDFWIVRLL